MKKRLSAKQIAEAMARHRNEGLDGERPQIATVTRIDDRTTNGSVTATLDRSGDTIWVETGGDIATLAVGDSIWVVPLAGGGVSGKRAQWMMFKFKETSGGSHVPTARAASLKVSELYASDADPQALDTDADGVMSALKNLKMDDGTGDSPSLQFVGGSNDDTVSIFLEDDATGGDSDLVIKLADAAGDSKLLIRDSGDVDVVDIDSNGNIVIDSSMTLSGPVIANLALDDGVGDSPSLQFIGGSNDDTISAFLEDDGTATDSDLVIKLADAAGDSKLIIRDSGDADVATIDSDGNITGHLSGNVIADDISGDTEDNTNFTLDLQKSQANNVYSIIRLLRSRGTIASPSAAQSGDILGRLAWRAYHSGSAWQNTALIEAVAGENHTATNQGTRIVFYRRLNGTAVDDQVLALAADGNVRLDLGDAAGADKFIIRDSGDAEVFRVTSDGVIGLSTSIDVRVVLSAAEEIADDTEEAIPWDAETYDNVDDNWAIGNATRLTAVRAGNYLISFGGEWAEDATGYRMVSIKLNGATYIAVDQQDAGNHYKFCISTQYEMSATDYVEAMVHQTSGGALNIINATYTYFAMTRLP